MGKLLWRPSEDRMKNTNLYAFIRFVNNRFGQNFSEYEPLYQWSIDNIPDFWTTLWGFTGIRASKSYDRVVDHLDRMPGARWFPGARINFAENLLRFRDESIALVFRDETDQRQEITYASLYRMVAGLVKAMKNAGIRPGDVVAGFMPNIPETVVAMLASTSLGAVWSSCSPDFGSKGVLDRFGQVKPKMLFAVDGYRYKGTSFDSLTTVSEIARAIPEIQQIIVVPYLTQNPSLENIPRSILLKDMFNPISDGSIAFEQLPFEHPLYIMFTSGTTGLPKCMVQSSGGVLINHQKEHLLQVDVKRNSTLFYFTTCGWMMWNWLVSALAVGATVVLYDGNPFHPDPGTLWKIAQDEKITIFGTSAGYLTALKNQQVRPGKMFNLDSLATILSTGAPLNEEGFEYVYRHVKQDVHLASISGGSDINGCFVAGNPMGPVYAGEMQARALGMKVQAFDESGRSVFNRRGELVCSAPSPSMPLYFWDDPENKKYRASYFETYPNVWCHGDFIEINDRGGAVIYGRSDTTLNPGGVRIGTAEIYRQIESMEGIEDSIVVGQNWNGDVRVVLFLKMAEGISLNDDLRKKIKTLIRQNASPRHVPEKIISVPDIPYTLNLKKVELAVKNIIEGKEVLNRASLKNPESLDFFADLEELEK